MIEKWNQAVAERDTVFVLGDFFDGEHCTKADCFNVIKQLNGKIVLIASTRDKKCLSWYKQAHITVIEYPIIKDSFYISSSDPQCLSGDTPYANIYGRAVTTSKTSKTRSYCVSAKQLDYKPILLREAKKLAYNRN